MLRKAGTFGVAEAGVVAIGFWIGEIDFLVGAVEIATYQNGFAGLQLFQVSAKGTIPIEAVRQSCEFGLGVRRVNIHDMKIGESRGDDAAFGIVLWDADAKGMGFHGFPGKDASA